MKSYAEVLNEHKKDAPITWVLMALVLFLASGLTKWPIVERFLFAVVVASVIMLACMQFQRYT